MRAEEMAKESRGKPKRDDIKSLINALRSIIDGAR